MIQLDLLNTDIHKYNHMNLFLHLYHPTEPKSEIRIYHKTIYLSHMLSNDIAVIHISKPTSMRSTRYNPLTYYHTQYKTSHLQEPIYTMLGLFIGSIPEVEASYCASSRSGEKS